MKRFKTKNIKLSSESSLSIRKTMDDGLHVAIFFRGIIRYRINKERLLRFGGQSFINYVSAAPILIPLPLAEVILNGVNNSLDLDDFYKIIKSCITKSNVL